MTAFPDCVLPNDCECAKRGLPMCARHHTACLVPGVNAAAFKLGWEPPYELDGLQALLHSVSPTAGRGG